MKEKEILDLIKQIKVDRENSNNRLTASPIYLVQTREERYANTNFDNADVEKININILSKDCYYPTIEDIKNGCLRETYFPCNVVMEIEETAENLEDVIEIMEENGLDKGQDLYIMPIEYYWITKAYFFSEQEAEDYRQYQSHNLGVSRIFVDYVGYDNRGSMAKLIKLIDEK